MDRPTLLPLGCIQNKNVSVACHIPGWQKYNARVKIFFKRSGYVFLFPCQVTSQTTHVCYSVFAAEHGKECKEQRSCT